MLAPPALKLTADASTAKGEIDITEEILMQCMPQQCAAAALVLQL